jgi:hypothetical protein
MSSVRLAWPRSQYLALPLGRVHPLLAIILLASVLRLWGLTGMPVLYFDSGAYLGEGRFLASVAQRSAGALFGPDSNAAANPVERVVRTLESGTAGHPPDLAKPGHAILLSIAILVLGTSTFAAGGAVSAVAGLATIAATYGLGSIGWNRRVGVAAAIMLAISGQHLVYSREPLVESDGLLFATLASLLYLRQVVKPSGGSAPALVWPGVLFGISFTCNNRLSYLALSLGIVELAVWRARGWRNWRPTVARAVVLGLGFLAPLIAIEAAYLGARGLAYMFGITPTWVDYIEQLANFARMNPPSRLRPEQWPTYFVDLIWMDGWPILFLLITGVIVTVVRRPWTRADLLLLGSLLVPMVLYSTYSSGEVRMRNFSLALPWLMLAASIGLWWIAARLRHPVLAASLALAALVLLALPRDIQLVTAPSAMSALVQTLRQWGASDVASTNGPVLSFLVGEDHTNARLRPAFINDLSDLDQLARQYPYLEVDMQAYWSPGQVTDQYDRATPVFEAPNGNDTWFMAFLLESQGMEWGGWSRVQDQWRTYHERATVLRLFRSRDVAQAQ